MLLRAGFTSVYLRVLRPQSGFTQRMSVSSTESILLIRSAISSVEGILGEWMSSTPGPIPAPYFTPSRKTDRSFSFDLEFSMVITSASMFMRPLLWSEISLQDPFGLQKKEKQLHEIESNIGKF